MMPTTVRLAPAIEQRLGEVAARTHQTKAYYIRTFIENGLEDLEDYLAAEAVMARVRAGEEELIDFEDVMKELGISEEDLLADDE